MKLKQETTLTLRYNPSLEECMVRYRGRTYDHPTIESDRLLASRFGRSPAALRLDALWIRACQRSGDL